ncbi:MAG: DegT/DnrJ/EryC1/StrS family aminotransferase [Candidatus Aminicenantes bacterium]|nr:DegT/DnrJ/EryC1/StrS family aminotransferase [Candidatus Aminicenantes bacterium]
MNVPFVDLKIQYINLKPEIDAEIQSVLDATAFVGGRFVEEFEKAFSEQYEVKHSISCGNGTDALYIAMKALGIGPGDDVITVANSWISTSETISQTGARPVFVDIEPDFYCIDVNLIEQKICSNTKAILPVHLYGHPAEISKIKDICEKHDLFLIEDCAQAHFATFKDKKVGTFGIAGTFSFYPGKNLGAYGDAGAIISDNDEFSANASMFANHGSLQKHKHEIEGINSRMDGIQAAVLNVKLKYIDQWNSDRYKNALYYNKLLADLPDVITPKIHIDANPIFHLYVIRTKQRDELANYLKSKEIGTGMHYPTALPFMPAYSYLEHQPSDFPIAFQYQNEILSLPMYPELTQDQIGYVVNAIKEFYS